MKSFFAFSKHALFTLLAVFAFLTVAEAQLINLANYSQIRREEGLIFQRLTHDETEVRKCVMNFHSDIMDDDDPNSESFDYVYLRATEDDLGDNNLVLTNSGMLVLGEDSHCRPLSETKADADTIGSIKLYVKGQIAVNEGNATNIVVSDERFKKNIKPLKNSLDVIRNSNFVEYEYNSTSSVKSNRKYYGILAQEIEKVLPSTVTKAKTRIKTTDKQSTEFYMFNPNDLIYSGLNAIKELDEKNQTLENKVEQVTSQNEALELRVRELEKMLITLIQSKDKNKNSASNSALSQLYQNTPNPLRESTDIEYYLPDNISGALIIVQDMNGKIITKFDLNGSGLGKVNFNAKEYGVNSGNYTYSLIVDGIPYNSKKMIFIE